MIDWFCLVLISKAASNFIWTTLAVTVQPNLSMSPSILTSVFIPTLLFPPSFLPLQPIFLLCLSLILILNLNLLPPLVHHLHVFFLGLV